MKAERRIAPRKQWVAAWLVALALAGCAERQYEQVSCDPGYQSILIVQAQAVPTATFVPCLLAVPPGWSYGGSEVRSGLARFWLDSELAGAHAVEVTLTRTCDVSGATRVGPATDDMGMQRFEQSLGSVAFIRYYLFRGGCVTHGFLLTGDTSRALAAEADESLAFVARSQFVKGVREDLGLTLCGAGAPPCPG